MATFGERLKRLRLERQWTQDEFAEKMSVDRTTVSNWERLHREPPYETLARIASVFGVTTDFLLGVHNTKKDDLAQRWPHLSPNRREKAATLVAMPGVKTGLGPDITDVEFDMLWAAVQVALQAGLAAAEVTRKAAQEGGSEESE